MGRAYCFFPRRGRLTRADSPVHRSNAKRAELGKGPGPSSTRHELTSTNPDPLATGARRSVTAGGVWGRRVQRADVCHFERNSRAFEVTMCIHAYICRSGHWFTPSRGRNFSLDAHNAARLELEARQAARRHHLAWNAHVQSIVQSLSDLARERRIRPGLGVDQHAQLVHLALL